VLNDPNVSYITFTNIVLETNGGGLSLGKNTSEPVNLSIYSSTGNDYEFVGKSNGFLAWTTPVHPKTEFNENSNHTIILGNYVYAKPVLVGVVPIKYTTINVIATACITATNQPGENTIKSYIEYNDGSNITSHPTNGICTTVYQSTFVNITHQRSFKDVQVGTSSIFTLRATKLFDSSGEVFSIYADMSVTYDMDSYVG
jgi:hypothetical protein